MGRDNELKVSHNLPIFFGFRQQIVRNFFSLVIFGFVSCLKIISFLFYYINYSF